MRGTSLAGTSLLLASFFASGCGALQLPAPAPPAREVPRDVDLPSEPPATGNGRVVLDVDSGKAKVIEITGTMTGVTGHGYATTLVETKPLCTTPCVLDLPYGSHPLVLQSTTDETRESTAELEVGPRPKVVRHALGERTDGGTLHTTGLAALGLGVIAGLTGAILWSVGSIDEAKSAPTGAVGRAITIGAIAAVAASIPLLILGRPTERPGSTTEWSLPAPNAPSLLTVRQQINEGERSP